MSSDDQRIRYMSCTTIRQSVERLKGTAERILEATGVNVLEARDMASLVRLLELKALRGGG